MNDPIQQGTLIVLGCTAAVALLALFFASLQGRREKDLAQMAEEMGFTFKEEDPALSRELFGPVQGLRVTNSMRNEANGLKLVVFDLECSLQSNSAVVTDRPTAPREMGRIKVTLLAFLDENGRWPRFSLYPRGHRRFLNRPIGKGVDLFENDKEFYRAMTLTARETAEVTRLFSDKVRSYFVQHGNQWVEADDNLLLYSWGRLINAITLRNFLENGFTVKRLLETGETGDAKPNHEESPPR